MTVYKAEGSIRSLDLDLRECRFQQGVYFPGTVSTARTASRASDLDLTFAEDLLVAVKAAFVADLVVRIEHCNGVLRTIS